MRDIQRRCPLFEMVGIFLFPNDLVRRRQINPLFVNGKYPEIPMIAREILENENILTIKKKPSRDDGESTESCNVITLFDVFKIVPRKKYPSLWQLVLRVLSFLPTTVGCEQSFSFLKRKLHQNMSMENAFNLCQASQRVTHFSFDKECESSEHESLTDWEDGIHNHENFQDPPPERNRGKLNYINNPATIALWSTGHTKAIQFIVHFGSFFCWVVLNHTGEIVIVSILTTEKKQGVKVCEFWIK